MNLLNDLKNDWLTRNREKRYPISIVVSALFDDTRACCRETGLKQHTYLHSLGFFGRVDKLPTPAVPSAGPQGIQSQHASLPPG